MSKKSTFLPARSAFRLASNVFISVPSCARLAASIARPDGDLVMSMAPITITFLAPAACRRVTCVSRSLAAVTRFACAAGKASPGSALSWAKMSLPPAQSAYSALASTAPRDRKPSTCIFTDGSAVASGLPTGGELICESPTAKLLPLVLSGKRMSAGFDRSAEKAGLTDMP